MIYVGIYVGETLVYSRKVREDGSTDQQNDYITRMHEYILAERINEAGEVKIFSRNVNPFPDQVFSGTFMVINMGG